MLVTDGVPYTYETIFQEYNQPHKPVRVFTYLIGREISDLEAAKWMACENKGYFTHVTTLAEVKEQVLKYIPVMARPLVLFRETHPVKWTGVYADIEVNSFQYFPMQISTNNKQQINQLLLIYFKFKFLVRFPMNAVCG